MPRRSLYPVRQYLRVKNALPLIHPSVDYDYTDLAEAMNFPLQSPRENMYDRLLRIKTNTTKEEFNKIVNDLQLAYLNSDKINEIHNKESVSYTHLTLPTIYSV